MLRRWRRPGRRRGAICRHVGSGGGGGPGRMKTIVTTVMTCMGVDMVRGAVIATKGTGEVVVVG
jgi:hypothetical protein